MYLVVSRGTDNVEVHIQFPATMEDVQSDLSRFDEYSTTTGPVQITGTSFCTSNLARHIRCADLDSEADVRKLSQLAKHIDSMDAQTQQLFSGALDGESINSLDDVLRIASHLDEYEFIQGVTSDKELGGWLVEHGLAGVDFPEQVRPYLDYAGIGAAFYSDHGGAYTAHGYVKHREVIQTQTADDRPAFALALTTARGACRLALPASEDDLRQAEQKLGVEDIRDAIIGDIEIGYPWAHLLPMNTISVEEANTLAECVSDMSKSELRTFGAALEAEEPDIFFQAVCIAMDLDDYELVDDSEYEYGREALRKLGADYEILDALDNFTDFERLGRYMMEEDGVQETAFGPVKRLSAPFPQQSEMGQTMY